MLNYLVSIAKKGSTTVSTIHDAGSNLKIKAVELLTPEYVPSKGEVSFFVTAGSEKLAFETRGYKKHPEVLILQMIAWYCIYSGLSDAQIHSTLAFLNEAI